MAEVLLNPYCTLQELRDEIRNEETDADVVDQLTRAINDASRFVDAKAERDFLPHDHSSTPIRFTKWSKEVCGNTVFLPYRVITLSEVKADGVVLAVETDYELLTTKGGQVYGLINRGGDWAFSEIEVKGTFGYTQGATTDVPTGIPSEIRRATILIAAAWSGKSTYEVIGMDGSKQEVASKNIPKSAMDLLAMHQPLRV